MRLSRNGVEWPNAGTATTLGPRVDGATIGSSSSAACTMCIQGQEHAP